MQGGEHAIRAARRRSCPAIRGQVGDPPWPRPSARWIEARARAYWRHIHFGRGLRRHHPGDGPALSVFAHPALPQDHGLDGGRPADVGKYVRRLRQYHDVSIRWTDVAGTETRSASRSSGQCGRMPWPANGGANCRTGEAWERRKRRAWAPSGLGITMFGVTTPWRAGG